jgi:crotonobetainyl-CoA:carnitine CoA-transferase CaiB-like acyl-CoA transferase
MMLAHLGADVIKVEPPSGDPLRKFSLRHQGLSAMFVNLNHGKTSVVLDLKTDEGRHEMLELLRGADVFLENWRPGVAAALGCDDECLEGVNPRLIHVAITGFGDSGPESGAPVFDMLLQAISGLASLESTDGTPTPLRSYIADKSAASFAAQAVLAALFERERTGQGTRIDVSMLDVMAYFNFPDLCQDRTFLDADAPGNLPRGRSGILATSDGFVAVSPVSGRQISATVQAAGHPEWRDDLRAVTNPSALINELYGRLETVTATSTTAEWLQRFRDADVPAAPALTADEHFAHRQTVHNELYSEGSSPAGPIRKIRHPALFDGAPLAGVTPPPSLDERAVASPTPAAGAV